MSAVRQNLHALTFLAVKEFLFKGTHPSLENIEYVIHLGPLTTENMAKKSFSDYLSLKKAFEVEILVLHGPEKTSMSPD